MPNAIVIGASSGIGRELALQLSTAGYRLGLAARRSALLEQLQAELPGAAVVQTLDVSETAAARAGLQALIEQLGGVDLIICAAGRGDLNPALDWHLEQAGIAVNVSGFTAVVNVAMQHFMARGAGHLVALTSIAGLRGGRAAPAYNAAKAFQSNYLEGLRQKVCHAGLPICVTDVQPGFVATAMAKGEGLFWVAPPAQAARQILRAIQARRSQVYVTRRWRLIAWLLKAMPGALYKRG